MLEQPVDRLLDRRHHPATRRRRTVAIAVSLALHLTVGTLFVLAPVWAARHKKPLEFVPVRIVPAAALGRPDAPPPAPRPEPEKPKPPAPEPRSEPETKPKPRPEPEPPTETPPRRPAAADRSAAAADAPPTDEPPARRGSPTGSPAGTSPFGGAVAGLDSPDFVYNYYVDQMLALIGAHWVRPPAESGVQAIVRFRIGRQGEVSGLELVESSGMSSFDFAGLRAVRAAAPLPPLPRDFPHDSLGVRLVIR